jgi:hypothetical protein
VLIAALPVPDDARSQRRRAFELLGLERRTTVIRQSRLRGFQAFDWISRPVSVRRRRIARSTSTATAARRVVELEVAEPRG